LLFHLFSLLLFYSHSHIIDNFEFLKPVQICWFHRIACNYFILLYYNSRVYLLGIFWKPYIDGWFLRPIKITFTDIHIFWIHNCDWMTSRFKKCTFLKINWAASFSREWSIKAGKSTWLNYQRGMIKVILTLFERNCCVLKIYVFWFIFLCFEIAEETFKSTISDLNTTASINLY
jgi:hypothetical protein